MPRLCLRSVGTRKSLLVCTDCDDHLSPRCLGGMFQHCLAAVHVPEVVTCHAASHHVTRHTQPHIRLSGQSERNRFW